jgi:hypothetical protein
MSDAHFLPPISLDVHFATCSKRGDDPLIIRSCVLNAALVFRAFVLILFALHDFIKGVQPARLDLLYPLEITLALRAALTMFEREKPGFASCPDALLHGVETRTRYK